MGSRSQSVIVYSPVRLASSVLSYTLQGLRGIGATGVVQEYWFHDDNDDRDSSRMLTEFCSAADCPARVLPYVEAPRPEYATSGDTHTWNASLVDRIIQIKNQALTEFRRSSAEAILLVDADLYLHPQMLEHLLSLDAPIVSEVFWTQFRAGRPYKPNVWDVHSCKYNSADSIFKLRDPGVYVVGGLGACTLVKKEVVARGVNFERIQSLDFWGEDRHFCVRATCMGYDLLADTAYPPFHVYRDELLPELQDWIRSGYAREWFNRWLCDQWASTVKDEFAPPRPRSSLSRLKSAAYAAVRDWRRTSATGSEACGRRN